MTGSVDNCFRSENPPRDCDFFRLKPWVFASLGECLLTRIVENTSHSTVGESRLTAVAVRTPRLRARKREGSYVEKRPCRCAVRPDTCEWRGDCQPFPDVRDGVQRRPIKSSRDTHCTGLVSSHLHLHAHECVRERLTRIPSSGQRAGVFLRMRLSMFL